MPTPQTGSAPPRILVVEDNLINQRMATLFLRRLGYNVDVAENGLEALQALQRDTYDIILMDMMMPVMGGLEATRHIVATYAPDERPKIIAVTANALPEDRRACLEAGMDAFLTKPYHFDELVDKVSAFGPLPGRPPRPRAARQEPLRRPGAVDDTDGL